MRNSYQDLVGKLQRKRPLGKYKLTHKNNIKMDHHELGYDAVP
jgi:hypothetical protein